MILSTMQPGSGFTQAINNRSYPKFLSESAPKPPVWGLNLSIGHKPLAQNNSPHQVVTQYRLTIKRN